MREHQRWDVSVLISQPLLTQADHRRITGLDKKRKQKASELKNKMKEYRRRIRDLQAKLDEIE